MNNITEFEQKVAAELGTTFEVNRDVLDEYETYVTTLESNVLGPLGVELPAIEKPLCTLLKGTTEVIIIPRRNSIRMCVISHKAAPSTLAPSLTDLDKFSHRPETVSNIALRPTHGDMAGDAFFANQSAYNFMVVCSANDDKRIRTVLCDCAEDLNEGAVKRIFKSLRRLPELPKRVTWKQCSEVGGGGLRMWYEYTQEPK